MGPRIKGSQSEPFFQVLRQNFRVRRQPAQEAFDDVDIQGSVAATLADQPAIELGTSINFQAVQELAENSFEKLASCSRLSVSMPSLGS